MFRIQSCAALRRGRREWAAAVPAGSAAPLQAACGQAVAAF